MTPIEQNVATMQRIADAAGDRPLTQSQKADFRAAQDAVLDAAERLPIEAIRDLGNATKGAASARDLANAYSRWSKTYRGGAQSIGRLVNEDDTTYGAPTFSTEAPQSYKSTISWGREFLEARQAGTKALLDPGAVAVSVPLAREPVEDARQATFVFQLIPGEDAPAGHFAYLRQTARTNNAAVVATGALKPTSTSTLERVDETTKTIAHLSEPVDRYVLEDAPTLSAFLDRELRYGLNKALDARVVAQIRAAAAAGSVTLNLAGIRGAITTLETADLPPTGIVLNPTDWQAVEAEASTQFASNDNMPAATDAMARRLYGIPVAVSNSIAAGTAIVGDFRGSAAIYRTGGASVTIHDSHPRTVNTNTVPDFALNQLVMRAEMRADVAVLRPEGFLEVGAAA